LEEVDGRFILDVMLTEVGMGEFGFVAQMEISLMWVITCW